MTRNYYLKKMKPKTTVNSTNFLYETKRQQISPLAEFFFKNLRPKNFIIGAKMSKTLFNTPFCSVQTL